MFHHSHGKHEKGKVSYLESPERRKVLSPEQLLNMIPLKENDSMLDLAPVPVIFPSLQRKGSMAAYMRWISMRLCWKS